MKQVAPISSGPSCKRPLDSQGSVWVVMRSVCEDWSHPPHLLVAMSGVFASKEVAEEARVTKHKASKGAC